MSGRICEMTGNDRHHVFVSPHPDDVVLSCGGTLARLQHLGCPVQVVTVFAEEPTGSHVSPFGKRHMLMWDAGPSPFAVRRKEDQRALALLGARGWYGQYLDAPFRRHAVDGRWLYQNDDALFGMPDPSEGDVPQRVAGEIATICGETPAVIYVPLGIGRHVDHVLLAAAGHHLRRVGYQVFWYEEFPYALQEGFPLRWEARGWEAHLVPLTTAEVSLKVQAILCYRSQLPSLFGDERHVYRTVVDYMLTVSGQGYPAERYWTPPTKYEQ